MSRLTDMTDFRIIPQVIENMTTQYDKEKEEYICKKLFDLNIDKDILTNQTQEINRLNKIIREYKELEEQGLLLRLPCKVGTTVYVVGTRCLAGEEPEYWCKTTECEECIYDKTYIVFERKVDYMMIYNFVVGGNTNFIFNKTVFLTKEEAEKELERIQNEHIKD